MKKLFNYIMMGALCLSTVACEDLDTLNEDPNNPQAVPSNMLMSGAEKWIADNVYDNWFSGRQCLVYAQYWSQRNYTEEDRYQIRESTNNGYFNYLYQGVANLNKVIELNQGEKAAASSAYGSNDNQIAAAMILRAWLMQIITDTWGNVPYSEVSKLESDGVLYCKYDDQKEIYTTLINELTEAVGMIDESEVAFTSGDQIFYGDASQWKKFGNSLKCRLAIHLSKVDSNWKKYIAEAVASGVMESNDDAAVFQYATSGSDYCKFYEGWYVDGRNDFTVTRQFFDLLSGIKDDLNGKSHPWEGTEDPRLRIYIGSNGTTGFPYGVPSSMSAGVRAGTPNWYYYPPCFVENKDFAVPLMTYAELKFILSEYNGFSESDYKEGVEASLDFWAAQDGSSISAEEKAAYIEAVSQNVNAEAVAVQKYIDLFLNGTEAWTEIRRTGYPEQLVRPGEVTTIKDGTAYIFEPLSEVKGDIIARVKYPTNESTLNGANWTEAVSKLQDGTNNYYTKMFWDIRTSKYDHPVNR